MQTEAQRVKGSVRSMLNTSQKKMILNLFITNNGVLGILVRQDEVWFGMAAGALNWSQVVKWNLC